MKVEKKYYRYLDLIRIVACIGVLLYHLGYLKGGFLSVCVFFVLSGYLATLSLSREKKISFKTYYKKRFIHIYLPLLAVVFLTTCIVSFIPVIHWFQLKPESASVILGYNNYWQLSVNADYFARHVSSPFMHLWYIGILLQFEIVFPFLFYLLKLGKEKMHKNIPIVFLIICIIASIGYFLFRSISGDIMISYYDTLARVYSLLTGVLLGYIHVTYKPLVFQSNKIFYFYFIIFILLQFIVDSSSILYAPMMILVSFITCRMIDYGVQDITSTNSFWEREAKYLANVSYEVYLFQYPVIFFFQYLVLPEGWSLPIMILLIFALSYFLHFCFDFKNQKKKYLRFTCCIFLSIFVFYGFIQYVMAKDYSSEMNSLKDQLSQNEKLLEEKQQDYLNRLQEENDEWNKVINDLNMGEEELKNYVVNLPIIGVGDSVMLGAIPTLSNQFPNGYFDVAVSRTDYEANRILQDVKYRGMLSDNVVIHLGTNGQCGLPCQREILSTCEGRNVFYVTVSNDYEVHVNDSFYSLAANYPNVHIIDWAGASNGHPEYFVVDGVHLTGTGMNAYSYTIYNGIYQFYYQQYEEKKNTILKEHEDKMNSKICFYGNDIFVSNYDLIQKEFPTSNVKTYDDSLYDLLLNDKNKNLLTKKIVIMMDNNTEKKDYQRIISLLSDHDLYFVFVYHKPYSFRESNVHVIDFYEEAMNQSDYFMVDGIHLSDKGNKKLMELFQKEINKKD